MEPAIVSVVEAPPKAPSAAADGEAPAWTIPLQRALLVDDSGRVLSGSPLRAMLGYATCVVLAGISLGMQFVVDARWVAMAGTSAGLLLLAAAAAFNRVSTAGQIDFARRRFLVPSNPVTPLGWPHLPIHFDELARVEVRTDKKGRHIYVLRATDGDVILELTQRDAAVSPDEVKAALEEATGLSARAARR